MSQKGVYPYDFMDSFEKFDQMELPTKDQFYGILNDQHITNDEYNHAKKVWKAFNIETMIEYHDLYLNPVLDGVRAYPILDGGAKKPPPRLTLSFSV